MENIIAHTTSSFEKLSNILTSTSFKLSFSIENFTWNGKDVSKAAHPMVSFSEFDPKTINNQKNTYGKYAIGFSKEWARNNEIGPVLYVSDSSVAAKGMRDLLVSRRKKRTGDKLSGKVRLAIMEVKCFMKNETGFNSYTKDEKFDFKSENEWRYIPRKNSIDNYLISQNQSTFIKNKEKHNKKLEKFPLRFLLKDLIYVFVPTEMEKKRIIELTGINKEKVKISKWRTK
jgi:hypothetical protein